MKEISCDILIIGGGLTGLLSASALFSLNKKIVLVDQKPLLYQQKKHSDFRTTAISEGSKIFLDQIGIWKKLNKFVEPINTIRVEDRKKSNNINFKNLNNTNFLGYIIKNSILKNILIKFLKNKKNIVLLENKKLNNIFKDSNNIFSIFNDLKINSALIIAADGKNSSVRKILKTPIYSKNYKHSALVVNFEHMLNHNNCAHELFYNSGPLAILPMQKRFNNFCSSMIWSNEKKFNNSLIRLDKELVTKIIEEKIINYVGKIIKINSIQNFNLSAHLNKSFYDNRLIYVGDSAHSIHPIAGQGWNLGIRDIRNIFEILNQHMKLGLDLGHESVCKKYNDASFYDAYVMFQATDKLNFIFLI